MYETVINAYAKSRDPDKSLGAKRILDRMLKSYRNGNMSARPNAVSYSTLLNACAYTRGSVVERDKSFAIAKDCMREILNSSKRGDDIDKMNDLNNVVFGTFLLCCSTLISPEQGGRKDRLIQAIFGECRDLGMVDPKVILNVRRAASPDLLRSLMEGTNLATGDASFDSIPNKWKANITKGGRLPSHTVHSKRVL